jgi:integrase
MATLLYGSALRLLECCRLRVQDIDFAMNQIVVRDAKGAKDRVTMLPAVAKGDLTYLRRGPTADRPSRRRGSGRPRARIQRLVEQHREALLRSWDAYFNE